MAQVSVTVNGRKYEISCDDGQETHLFRLAEEVDRRIASLVASVGQVGEARLLVLLSLLLTDELEEHKKELEATRAGASPDSHMTAVDGSVGEELRGLAERIEAMAERLASERMIAETPGPA
jgi:cell division protein ZapA